MDDRFNDDEKLYRAVYPPEVTDMFWKRDGSLSSTAFADPKGLSVDRGFYRSDEDVITSMHKRFTGRIECVYIRKCNEISTVVKYLPSSVNKYHSEIHGSEDVVLLSKPQRRHLVMHAIVFM